MTTWLPYPDYKIPFPAFVKVASGGYKPQISYDMAIAIRNDVRSCRGANSFVGATPDPQYKNPVAYIENFVAFAHTLTQTSDSAVIPFGWNPEAEGLKAANIVFGILQQLPVDPRDPANSNDIFDAWMNGDGQKPGGWPADGSPVAVATGDGFNVSTGPSAAPVGILGGNRPQ